MMKTYLISVQSLMGALLLLTLSACNSEADKIVAVELSRPAKIFEIKDLSQRQIRNFPAEVEAHQGSLLAFRVNGELNALHVLPGQNVKKGQLLATLAPKDFQLQVDERKARFELAESKFNRTKTLRERNISSAALYDEAKANMLVAESVYKKAQTDLKYTELRAPFAGTISQTFVENYENIQAKQKILFLQNQDLLDVSIRVPERLFARAKRDLTYQPSVTFEGFRDESYLLTIHEWDSQADPQTLTYRVVFSLPRPKGFNLLPGMTGNVKVDLSRVMSTALNEIIVPVESVLSSGNEQAYVWLYHEKDNSVSKATVEIGDMHQSGIEIISGLKVGDKIVAAGGHYLHENMKVRPWTREQGL